MPRSWREYCNEIVEWFCSCGYRSREEYMDDEGNWFPPTYQDLRMNLPEHRESDPRIVNSPHSTANAVSYVRSYTHTPPIDWHEDIEI
jgi:hypothetical protein